MMCAMELNVVKVAAETAYLLEEQRKDESAKVEFIKAQEATITLCETTINDELVKRAKSRLSLVYEERYVESTDRLGNTLFHPLTEDAHGYADGTPSYSVNRKVSYSKETLEEYLSSFCLSVKWETASYCHWGCGACYCKRLVVKAE